MEKEVKKVLKIQKYLISTRFQLKLQKVPTKWVRLGKGIRVEVDAPLVTKRRQVCMSACHLCDQRVVILPDQVYTAL